MDADLKRQIDFIYTLEKMKTVYRRTHLVFGDRYENDAEHSFHIAAMALILKDHAPSNVDIGRVVSMLLFHDVVEIEAGDTFAYDKELNKSKREREVAAADKLYGSLPKDLGDEFRNLWEEFEAQETPESHFALAMDRMEPILLNAARDGGSWNEHHIRYQDVLDRIAPIKRYPKLYDVILKKVDDYFNEEVNHDKDITG